MVGPSTRSRWPDVGEFVEAYESARARDGRAELADFAPPPDHPERLAILCELVRVDLEYQWQDRIGNARAWLATSLNPETMAGQKARYLETLAAADAALDKMSAAKTEREPAVSPDRPRVASVVPKPDAPPPPDERPRGPPRADAPVPPDGVYERRPRHRAQSRPPKIVRTLIRSVQRTLAPLGFPY